MFGFPESAWNSTLNLKKSFFWATTFLSAGRAQLMIVRDPLWGFSRSCRESLISLNCKRWSNAVSSSKIGAKWLLILRNLKKDISKTIFLLKSGL